MGKSSTKIGMVDVHSMLRAIESLHGCEVLVTLEPCSGADMVSGMSVSYVARFPPTLERNSAVYCTHSEIWHISDVSLSTALYRGLHALDAEIQRQYKQKNLSL